MRRGVQRPINLFQAREWDEAPDQRQAMKEE